MSLADRVEQFSGALATAAAATVISTVFWIVRRVFTNQKQIEMLQREIQFRDKTRDEDRELIREMRDDVRDLRAMLTKK